MLKVKVLSLLFSLVIIFSCNAQQMSTEQGADGETGSQSLLSNFKLTKEVFLGRMLGSFFQNVHYVKKTLDDDLSKQSYKVFLERVDYAKQFLLQEDVEAIAKYKDKFDDELLSGRLDVVDLSVKIMGKRLKHIKKYVQKRMKKPFDFKKKESFETDPEKREFLSSMTELEKRWDKTLKMAVLSQYLDYRDERDGINSFAPKKDKKDEKKDKKKKKDKDDLKKMSDKQLLKKATDKIAKRYDKIFKRMKEQKRMNQLDKFYNSIAKVFDPHTVYLIPEEKEDFDIDMRGSLEGIGALLQEEGSYIKVKKIIPGSASWKGKELKAEDTILGVGQGDEEIVDIVDMSIRDAVKLIRGPKGTVVTLKIKKASDSTVKTIQITRDKVILEASYAKGAVLEHDEIKDTKIGYIKVPKFYRDFRDDNGRNSSTDVRIELEKLNKIKNVKGAILDLRGNGGGALVDASIMAGLFIKEGPIVQVVHSSGETKIHADEDPKVQFDKPLIVLVDRFSASASEIVAAALQDYERAIIVGSSARTHGKGTVQVVLDLDRQTPVARAYSPLGALKITIQMFFRVNGSSTQVNGVTPDIILPDRFSYLESGEEHLDHVIPYKKIKPVKYKKWNKDLMISKLREKSENRVAKSKVFNKYLESANWYEKRKEETMRSLHIDDMVKLRATLSKKADEFDIDYVHEKVKFKSLFKVKNEVDKEVEEEFGEELRKDPVIEETLFIFKDLLQA